MVLKKYEKAEVKLIEFGTEDVLTASSAPAEETTDGGGFGWEEEEEGW